MDVDGYTVEVVQLNGLHMLGISGHHNAAACVPNECTSKIS